MLSPDGQRVLSCASKGDSSVSVWDAAAGTLLFQSVPLEDGFEHLAIVPGQRQCVSAGRDGVGRLWQWRR